MCVLLTFQETCDFAHVWRQYNLFLGELNARAVKISCFAIVFYVGDGNLSLKMRVYSKTQRMRQKEFFSVKGASSKDLRSYAQCSAYKLRTNGL